MVKGVVELVVIVLLLVAVEEGVRLVINFHCVGYGCGGLWEGCFLWRKLEFVDV